MRKRLRGYAIRPVQLGWLALVVVIAIGWTVAFLRQWSAFHTACHPVASCNSYQLDVASARILAQHGITLSEFAVMSTAVLALCWAVWTGLAALIIWRRPDDRGAVLAAYGLVVGIGGFVFGFTPGYEYLSQLVGFPVLLLTGLLFPDGRFIPSWTRRLAMVMLLLIVATSLPSPLPTLLSAIPLLASPVIAIWAQVYRYRRVSSWEQRQQSKWAFMGILAGLLGFLVLAIPFIVTPQIVGYGSIYDGIVNVSGTAVVTSGIPIGIAIAILKSRLWDIDRVINRALVYGSLTVTLAALYIGSVLALEPLFQLLGAGGSNLAIAISTLIAAALFSPLRRYIQIGIDRRFYRRKYDATRTLADFTARVRDEVELAQVSRDVTDIVKEVLQPAHVSLWLAGSQEGGKS
jgi:hypothetical protein